MTTYTNSQNPAPAEDPYANKAVAAALVTLLTVIIQLASSNWKISLDQEGITAIGGAVTTIAVWAISNWKRGGV